MRVCLEPISEDDQPIEGLHACGCRAATRVVRTEHGSETHFAHALVLELCAWHRGVQETFERMAGQPLPYPVWVPEGSPLACPREGCGQPVAGLRRELALPHPYYPHDRYVAVCLAHQGVPIEWVPLDLPHPEMTGLPP